MKTDYSINDLKERITIEKVTVTKDAELNRIPTYAVMGEVWAAMLPVRAYTQSSDAQLDAKVNYTVVLRKQPLEAKIERITWNGCHYYPVAPWVVTDKWMIGDFTVEAPNG